MGSLKSKLKIELKNEREYESLREISRVLPGVN